MEVCVCGDWKVKSKLLYLWEFQFPHLYKGDKHNLYLIGGAEDSVG